MSSSSSTSSKPPPHLRLHVDTTTTNGSAASPGSASSSHSSRSPRPSSAPAGAGAGGIGQNQTHQACAACKYQRRKCSPDCPLAPYFPADQQRVFLNAHRLFGVRNLQRTLDRIDPEHGPAAMRSLIFQSEARAADPVGGCVGIIEDLQREIQRTQLQLAYVKHQIAIYRQAAAAAAAGDPLAVADPAAMLLPAAVVAGHGQDNAVAVDAFYAGDPPGAGLVFQDQRDYDALKIADDPNHPTQQQQQQQQELYNYFCYDGTAGGGEEANSHALGEQMEQHCQIEAAVPFVDAFDVKPQGLPVATERCLGPADVRYGEENVAAVPNHDVDQHMEEPARTAGAPCHLELGFSS